MKKLIPLFAVAAFILSCQSTPPAESAAKDSIPKQASMYEKGISKDADKKTLSMIIIPSNLPLHIMNIDGVKQFTPFTPGLSGSVYLEPGMRKINYAYDGRGTDSPTEYHLTKQITFDFQPGMAYQIEFEWKLLHFDFNIIHNEFLPIE
jgi:hypothetical protein